MVRLVIPDDAALVQVVPSLDRWTLPLPATKTSSPKLSLAPEVISMFVVAGVLSVHVVPLVDVPMSETVPVV